jgi:hypothetical protein
VTDGRLPVSETNSSSEQGTDSSASRLSGAANCLTLPRREVTVMKIQIRRVEEIKATVCHIMPNIGGA